ncbi:hypothetical protein A2625_05695 [candidate division WOR-1 bacterium RIFCSPHIGHO2_01_FULL_53_15]|uniref:Intracellular proteinase inhibitor BsuPI domain-containing protein n=1 Tax=candidate division WOR-1 bacterium RIFCSPHIGHO2_01_FULL_53_15 TaxID=1802564 RepID=A0A1F4Q337_UNCSA|nr:MAG: hypothetical protein A2625_05695 [candidate division WOR-1 bacterium RIFCSPHIGHO2_01_FULL_53_15]OGC10525.1 MAG: hypothetical protein A3D23_04235 [candidate division WOR-1 bacterium RIFCSPHIGHO2_02_FULL_53_26]
MIKKLGLLILLTIVFSLQSHSDGVKSAGNGFSLALASDQAIYRAGEPVKLKLVATNNNKAAVNLLFGSGQSFDLVVTDKNSKTIWKWSHDKVFTMAVREVEVAPRKTLEFSAVWPQTDNEGRPVTKGKYFIAGQLTSAAPAVSKKRSIIIK